MHTETRCVFIIVTRNALNSFLVRIHFFQMTCLLKKILEQLLAFPRKSSIQPENNETHGTNWSPLYVANGRFIRLRVAGRHADSEGICDLNVIWRKFNCVNKERNEGKS